MNRVAIAVVCASVLAVLPLVTPATADPPEFDYEGLRRQTNALVAVDVDPWLLDEAHIEERQAVIDANLAHHLIRVGVQTRRLERATEAFDRAEAVRLATEAEHQRLEAELEGFAIASWARSDASLSRGLTGEVSEARVGQSLDVSAETMVAQTRAAEAAWLAAVDDAALAADELAAVTEVHDRAVTLLENGRDIADRFAAALVARDEAIAQRTAEVLAEGDEIDIDLVPVSTITVQVPIEVPVVSDAAGDGVPGDEAAVVGAREASASEDGGDAATGDADGEVEVEVPTEPVEVAITPIIVNAAIAEQVRALLGAAWSDGIELEGGGHRDRAMQIELRLAHCGNSGYAIFDLPSSFCSPPTARPGHSQHELGLAIDFTVGGVILDAGSPGFAWLSEHAADYGLLNLESEPWHWSTTGG